MSSRKDGTNPRALGINPKALGINPRALGTNPKATKQQREAMIVALKSRIEVIEKAIVLLRAKHQGLKEALAIVEGPTQKRKG